ncbi:MAG: hypothetical protein JNK82_35150 [Myxococcaceae bacterium]|nr:hypothetical protein [Myxococcaceae bacterium]
MTPRLKCGLAGVALLVISPLLLKWSVFDVLEQARAGSSEVSWSEKSHFVIPLAFFGGLAGIGMASMPKLWVDFVPGQKRRFGDLTSSQKLLVIALVAATLLAGFALRSWVLGELQTLGYEVS